MQVLKPKKVVKPTRAKPVKKRAQVDQAHKQRQEVEFLQDLSGLHGKFIEKDDRAHTCGRWTPSKLDFDGLSSDEIYAPNVRVVKN